MLMVFIILWGITQNIVYACVLSRCSNTSIAGKLHILQMDVYEIVLRLRYIWVNSKRICLGWISHNSM